MIKYSYDAAMTEACRCLMCEDAPCFNGCPAQVNPKYFIRKIRFGDLSGAVKMLREQNILAGSIAYICPCLKTCGAECTSEKISSPIDISGLQRFVMDWEREATPSLTLPPPFDFAQGMLGGGKIIKNGKKVAVVGSGPAGLACAAKLVVNGFEVDVFEKEKKAGGQLRLSIPSFRLPEEVLDHEIEYIKKLGVNFHFKKEITDLEKLKDKYDAVFVATGLMKSKPLQISGADKKNVFDALDILIKDKRSEKIELGKKVLVIGGGDTAIDAARMAARAGLQTLLLYRRTQKDMPAYRPDIEEAFEEGVEFWFRVVPVEIVGDDKVTGLKVRRVKWKGEGRLAKEYTAEGEDFVITADSIINAVGQEKADIVKSAVILNEVKDPPLKHVKTGGPSVAVLPQDDSGILFGGDYASGGSTAVAAIGDGKAAADKIISHCAPSAKLPADRRNDPRLRVTFCGVEFENPFILAAAPPTDELEMVRNAFRAGWAGAVLKTTSVEKTAVPLKYPMMSGLDYESKKLVSMGNIDLISEHHIDVVEDRVQKLKAEFPDKKVIASIMGSCKEEWQSLVTRLSDAGADMIECSFSCPQGSLGAKAGQMLAQDAELTRKVAGWVKEAASKHHRNIPVVIKITPHVTDICEVARAVKDAGADAVCASNTIQSLMGIDLEDLVPFPKVEGKSAYSGMSGPAIKPITLKVISDIAKNVGIPITGTGGPVTWSDALEFMLCGATTVQFCTAVMHYGLDIIDDLKGGVINYMERKKIHAISELIGRSLPFIKSHEELTYKKKVVSKIDLEKCIRDDLCFIACRDGGHMAIELDAERTPKVDEEKCTGCGLCRLVCPVTNCIRILPK